MPSLPCQKVFTMLDIGIKIIENKAYKKSNSLSLSLSLFGFELKAMIFFVGYSFFFFLRGGKIVKLNYLFRHDLIWMKKRRWCNSWSRRCIEKERDLYVGACHPMITRAGDTCLLLMFRFRFFALIIPAFWDFIHFFPNSAFHFIFDYNPFFIQNNQLCSIHHTYLSLCPIFPHEPHKLEYYLSS